MLLKIYSPLSAKYKWLTNGGATTLQMNPAMPKSGELLIITKSMKDVMVLHELGYSAIAPQSETIVINPARYGFDYKQYVIFYDNDEAGRETAEKYPAHMKKIYLPGSEKDISDYVKANGVEEGKRIMRALIYDCILFE